MKKVLVFTLVVGAVLAGCLKGNNTSPIVTDCTPVSDTAEEPTIKAFADKDTIAYTRDTSFVYYHIVDSGTGNPAPTTMFARYNAKLLSGTELSTAPTPQSLTIVNLIQGVQDLRRFYKKGARIIMIIPSSLAYGCQGSIQNNTYVIPPNSIVYFDFTIQDVQ